MELNKRQKEMLKTLRAKTRFWRELPETASQLWKMGLIEPTKFGMGNFQLTARNAELDRESQRLSDQLGSCDRERIEWIKRAEKAEIALNHLAEILHGSVTDVALLPVTAQSLLARTKGNYSAIPNGWKIVPLDPSIDMVEAGAMAVMVGTNTDRSQLCWSEMLAAAPLPPSD